MNEKKTQLQRLKVVIEDFEKLSDRIHETLDQSEEGNGKTMRLVLDIPAEYATLAAWLDLRRQAYHERLKPFNTEIDIPPVHAHKKRAKRYLYSVIQEWFHDELHELCTYQHPWLSDCIFCRNMNTDSPPMSG